LDLPQSRPEAQTLTAWLATLERLPHDKKEVVVDIRRRDIRELLFTRSDIRITCSRCPS
jgi:hypothetical protein